MIRLRNETITIGLKRKPINPVLYERVDESNVRIGTKWFKFEREQVMMWPNAMPLWNLPVDKPIERRPIKQAGVTIYHGKIKQFIANSWYSDINTDEL